MFSWDYFTDYLPTLRSSCAPVNLYLGHCLLAPPETEYVEDGPRPQDEVGGSEGEEQGVGGDPHLPPHLQVRSDHRLDQEYFI